MTNKCNDRELVLKAVKKNGWALQYASIELKNDREIVLEAVKRNGCALQYASELLRNDREVVLEAVKEDKLAVLGLVSETIKNDKEFMLEAVAQDGNALRYASTTLQANLVMQMVASRQNVYPGTATEGARGRAIKWARIASGKF